MCLPFSLARAAVLAGLLSGPLAVPAVAHEYWTGPAANQSEMGQTVRAERLVGAVPSGEAYPFTTDQFVAAQRLRPGGVLDIEAVEANLPAPGVTPTTPAPALAATAGIDVSLTPTRTSGVAPLAVLFDATNTTSTSVSDPFRELEYSFDFGDERGQVWATSRQPKNRQVGGPIAAHVFDVPGTYTVRVRATDPNGGSAEATTTITVLDPDEVYSDALTVCVSPTSSYDGCPAGAARQTSYPASFNGRRVLLRRGESFPAISIQDGNSGVLVGAYGAGDEPRVDRVGVGDLRPSSANFANDITVMDLHVADYIHQAIGHRVLFYRNVIPSTGQEFSINFGGYEWWANHDQYRVVPSSAFYVPRELFLVENVIVGNSTARAGGIFGGGSRVAIMGNLVTHTLQHNLRIWLAHKSFVGHNDLRGNSLEGMRQSMKFHAMGLADYSDVAAEGGKASQQNVVADNIFGSAEDNNQWTAGLCPQNGETAEGVEDAIVENNTFHAGPRTALDLVYSGKRITVRGNRRWDGSAITTGRGHYLGLPSSWNGPYY